MELLIIYVIGKELLLIRQVLLHIFYFVIMETQHMLITDEVSSEIKLLSKFKVCGGWKH